MGVGQERRTRPDRRRHHPQRAGARPARHRPGACARSHRPDRRSRRLRAGRRLPVLRPHRLLIGRRAAGRRRRYAWTPVTPRPGDGTDERTPIVQTEQRFDQIANDAWEGLLEREPLLGTFVGDERYDDRLSDPSEAGRSAEESAARSGLKQLADLDRADLDEGRQLTADIYEAICSRVIARLEHRLDLLDVANHMNGAVSTLGQIAALQRADTPERVARLAGRLRAFPAYIDASIGLLREGVAKGVTAPRVVTERTLAQVDRLLALAPDRSPVAVGVEGEARETIAAAVADAVQPSLEAFRQVLVDDYLPASTETIGISALPGGDGMYAAEVLGWTSLPLDPGEVHELGVERLKAINEERWAVAAELGYDDPVAAIAAHTASGANTAATPEDLVALAEDQVQRSWDLAPQYFGRLPSANCEVRRVEEFREADEPMAFYYPPTDDGSRAGIYYINCYDLADRALHHVASVTYHEANPGHHFQLALQQEMPERPPLRRFGATLAAAAFAEGWGLYAERLADEMGLYLDGWERMGMLENQGLRAARLVTDSGIHALGWTREQAVNTLIGSGQARTGARLDPRAGGDHAYRERADPHRRRDRGRPLHRDAGPGALLHDRDDGDPARPCIRVGAAGRELLAA